MNKTQQTNQKSLQAINKLKLPDYTERYKRLNLIGVRTGRKKNNLDIWEAFSENWSTDMEMLKL